MSQFNDFREQLNKSLTLGHPTSNSLFDNGSFLPQAPKGTSDKMPLVPRTPVVGLADNNKAKNKRTGSTKPKPRPEALKLQPHINQE